MKYLLSQLKQALKMSISVLVFSVGATALLYVVYLYGYFNGINTGFGQAQSRIDEILNESTQVSSTVVGEAPTPTPRTIVISPQAPSSPNWSGPELWEEVNKRRKELGVNSLENAGELCTIASIRLNELLDLGKLDGHEGFGTLAERREDLKWIFEKYNISEFLVSGAVSAKEAVGLWENTLGHKKLLTGGEYVWGCTYAQNGFGVGIAAY